MTNSALEVKNLTKDYGDFVLDKEDYQYKVLVRNRNKAAKNYPKAIVSPATIEEIMLFYVKGELQ